MFLLMFAKGRKNVSESSLVGYKNNNINSNDDDVRRRSCWRFIFGSIANQWRWRWRMSDYVQKDGIMYWGKTSAVNWDCNSKSHNGIKVWNILHCILHSVNLWNSFAIFPIISLLCLLVHFIRFNCSTNKLSPPSSWEMIFFSIYAWINWCDK